MLISLEVPVLFASAEFELV